MRKKIAVCLILFLAVALCIGIPKLIPDEPYDLSDVPRFYAANGYSKYLNQSTGCSFGPVRAPSDAIDYAVSYRLAQCGEEFDIDYETTKRGYHAYYDPDYDLWMVWDYTRYFPVYGYGLICWDGSPGCFLTFIRGSDGMILGFLPGSSPADHAFEPPQTPAA